MPVWFGLTEMGLQQGWQSGSLSRQTDRILTNLDREGGGHFGVRIPSVPMSIMLVVEIFIDSDFLYTCDLNALENKNTVPTFLGKQLFFISCLLVQKKPFSLC